MARRLSAEMATTISLSTVKAAESLKGLTSAVTATKNAWKAEETQQKSVGNSLGAAEAKFKGLGAQVVAQKNKLHELQLAQSKLLNVNKSSIESYKKYQATIDELKGKQSKLDTSTKAGAEQFDKLSEQIAKTRKEQISATGVTQKDAEVYLKKNKQISAAKKQLASYEAQEKRARKTMSYYRSGLASLQKEYKKSNKVSESYVKRLKAEGKQSSATLKGYKKVGKGLKNLKKQQNIQEKEQLKLVKTLKKSQKAYKEQETAVKRAATEHGKNSEQYKKAKSRLNELDLEVKESKDDFDQQRVRVNKTATAVAESSNKYRSLQKQINRINPTGIKRLNPAMAKVSDNAIKMKTRVRAGFSKVVSGARSASIAIGATGVAMYKGASMASKLQNTYRENTNLMITAGEKTKAVTGEVSAMQKDGRKYSIAYGESQHNIASGYQELIKRGYDGKQSLGAMKSILQASKASGDDFSDTMSVTTSTLEAFGLKTTSTAGMMKNTKKVANSLAMAADATATDFKSLGVGMSYVGTTAHNAGLSLNDTSTAMGVLSNNGLEADKAGTGLRKTINSLMSPTKGAQEAFKKYNMSIDDFKDKSGKLKPVSEIFKEIAKSVPQGDKANFFHNVFGTTGQQAAQILAQNTNELDKVNKQVSGAYKNNYIGKLANKNMKSTQNATKQFKQAANAVLIELGSALMPALSKTAKSMAKALDSKEAQRGLKTIAKWVGKAGNKIADVIEYLGTHQKQVETFGKILLAAVAGRMLIKGMAATQDSLQVIGGLVKKVNSGFSQKAVSTEMQTTAVNADKATASAGKLSGKFKVMPKLISGVTVALAALPAAIDVGGSIANSISSHKTKDKIKAASKTTGTAIGGLAGGLIGGPMGAAVGANIGDALGSTKVAQNAVKKMKKSWDKAVHGIKVKAPRINTSDAQKSLNKYSKMYKNQQLKDLKTLKKSGNLSDAEYKKQVAAVKKAYNQKAAAAKKGGKNETLVAKYYAKQKQNINTNYNKKRKQIHTKYDAEVERIERTYGRTSEQYKKANAKREKALDKASSNHKKKISQLNIKYAQNDMTKEAKAHMTLTGKIGQQSNKQGKILSDLTSKKKKLSNSQLATLVKNAQKEYNKTVSLANQRRNKIVAAADKQRKKVKDAARRQFKSAQSAAENQKKATINAANRQYKGNSKAAKRQRAAVAKAAEKQRSQTVEAARKQKNKTLAHADSQHRKAVKAADDQRRSVKQNAKRQKSASVRAAKKQSKGVTEHALKQANNSMRATSKQGKGNQSIWDNILKFINGLTKPFGLKPLKNQHGSYHYTPVTMHGGYSIGGKIKQAGTALVGEAGPELRYKPYSGKVDVVGQTGPEVIKVNNDEQILNAEDTKKVLQSKYHQKLPGYAKGNISLNSFLKKAKDSASSVWDKVKDISDSVLDKLKHPVKSLGNIVKKDFAAITGVKNIGKVNVDWEKGAFKNRIKGIGKKLKELATSYDDYGDAGGAAGNPKGHGVQRWKKLVKKALRANGLSTSKGMINKVLRQIATESGGNPKAVQGNVGDINNKTGDLAKGLMQTISATFKAYAFPGHHKIFNGYDNLLSALHYAKSRYGKSLAGLGNGHGYANGGFINSHRLIEVGEGNQPEAVIPLSAMKSSQAYKVLGQVVTRLAGNERQKGNNNSVSDDSSKAIDELNKKFDTLLTMFGKLLGVSGAQLSAIKAGSFNKTQLYQQQAADQTLADYQSLQ